MLSKSDTSISSTIQIFKKYGVRCSFLVPTETGLNKSIMDAGSSLRQFLLDNKIHNYEDQKTGPENKIIISGYFVYKNKIEETKISLYRPNTKSGDPRIWFSNLKTYAKPFNLLALTIVNNKIYIINSSNNELIHSLTDSNSSLRKIFSDASESLSEVADELLTKLKEISSHGFVPSTRIGDTGVGKTLEDLLDINANSSKKPDYKGIEIKASRHLPKTMKAKTRVNLFSQVPDWKNSPIGKAITLLKEYGYKDSQDVLRLAVTLSALKPNKQNLMFKTDIDRDILLAIHKNINIEKELLIWSFKILKERLLEKHNESFWVKADFRIEENKEFFHYYQVVHTEKPFSENLPYLINDGIVQMDFTLKQKTGNTTRDHGYLFKLWPENFDLVFPDPKTYSLT